MAVGVNRMSPNVKTRTVYGIICFLRLFWFSFLGVASSEGG